MWEVTHGFPYVQYVQLTMCTSSLRGRDTQYSLRTIARTTLPKLKELKNVEAAFEQTQGTNQGFLKKWFERLISVTIWASMATAMRPDSVSCIVVFGILVEYGGIIAKFCALVPAW